MSLCGKVYDKADRIQLYLQDLSSEVNSKDLQRYVEPAGISVDQLA